jgi:hypothetical protein
MRSTISQIYFGKDLYMFQTDLLSIIRSFNTVYTAIGICHASYIDCLLAWSGAYHNARSSECQILDHKLTFIQLGSYLNFST